MKPKNKQQITKDSAYDAVAPGDFAAMIAVDRYGRRSTAFDKIISATHDHFWDPLDPKYVDFAEPFDLAKNALLSPSSCFDLQTAIGDKLNEDQKRQLVNDNAHWLLSTALHGEQAALSLSASLCHVLLDPGAQEYAANQAREEARHVTAFARYIQTRWGKPAPVGEGTKQLLTELVLTPLVWKKLVGMQIIVEGAAMGLFASIYRDSTDPVLTRMVQLVSTDEAFHHKFGKIWADRTIPKLDQDEKNAIEDWAWEVWYGRAKGLLDPTEKPHIYAKLGLDPQWCQNAFMEALTDKKLREIFQDKANLFRTLAKTLLKAGIITQRTAGNYAAFIDLAELHAEGEHTVGDDIAEEGIKRLRALNGIGAKGAASLQAAE